MIAVTIDKLCAKHPSFEKYVSERIDAFYETSTAANSAVFLISGITAGLLCGRGDFTGYAALGVMIAAWIWTSLLAGFLRQWLFIAVPSLYLMLPHLLYILPGTTADEQASQMQRLLSDFSDGIMLQPIKVLAGSADLYIVSVITFGVCAIIFLLGLRIRSRAKRSNVYCKKRLDQLNKM